MKNKHLKRITIGLGLLAFLIGLNISFSSYSTATAASTDPENCYDSQNLFDCPAQTSATVSIEGSSTQTVALVPGSNNTWTIKILGQEISIPIGSGTTKTSVTSTNGVKYTVTIVVKDSYEIKCNSRTSPGGQPCTVVNCLGSNVQTYLCNNPGGTSSTSN